MRPSAIDRIGLADASLGALPLPEPGDAPRGPSFDRYTLEAEMGSGGSGAVFRAWDPEERRYVALKILKMPSRIDAARLAREAHAATRLSHPNIVKVHRTGTCEAGSFIAMELVEGRTLAEARDAPLRQRIEWFRVVCEAVHHAHGRGIVHRDLKPSNILIDHEGHPYVADFGIARPTQPGWTLTLGEEAVGTPDYMSPEQFRPDGKPPRPATDVYSLGAVLYEMLTGAAPFRGRTPYEVMEKVVSDPPVPPRKVRADAPPELELICLKCLEKKPAQRYASAQELAEDVGRWLRGEPVLARPPSASERFRRTVTRHRALLVPAAIAVLALAGVAAWRLAESGRRASEAGAERLLESARPAIERAVRSLYVRDEPYEPRLRDVEAAHALIEEATRKAPRLAAAHHLKGRAWELRGRDDEAERCWREAVAIDPDFAPARFALARLLAMRAVMEVAAARSVPGRTPSPQSERLAAEAVLEIERAVRASPSLERPIDAEIAAALQAAVRADAEGLARIAGAGARKFAGVEGVEIFHWLLAQAESGAARRAALDEALRIRPRFPPALCQRSVHRYHAGDFAGARDDADEAVRIDPRFAAAFRARGGARRALGDVDGAIADYTEALRLDPSDAASLLNRGNARREKGDLAAAIADYTEALRLHPSFAEAFLGRAGAREGDDPDGALADYDEHIRLRPQAWQALYARARLRLGRGDRDGAAADVRRVLELAPADAPERAAAERFLRKTREQ